MCRLRNIATRDYQESVTTGQTHRRTDTGQSVHYAEDCMCRLRNIATRDYQESVTTGQTPDKVFIMCRYASQAKQKWMQMMHSEPIFQYPCWYFLQNFTAYQSYTWCSIIFTLCWEGIVQEFFSAVGGVGSPRETFVKNGLKWCRTLVNQCYEKITASKYLFT